MLNLKIIFHPKNSDIATRDKSLTGLFFTDLKNLEFLFCNNVCRGLTFYIPGLRQLHLMGMKYRRCVGQAHSLCMRFYFSRLWLKTTDEVDKTFKARPSRLRPDPCKLRPYDCAFVTRSTTSLVSDLNSAPVALARFH